MLDENIEPRAVAVDAAGSAPNMWVWLATPEVEGSPLAYGCVPLALLKGQVTAARLTRRPKWQLRRGCRNLPCVAEVDERPAEISLNDRYSLESGRFLSDTSNDGNGRKQPIRKGGRF